MITGASSHIGATLAHTLVARERTGTVCALRHRQDGAAAGCDIQWVKADILDKDSLTSAFLGAEIVL